MRGLTRAEVVGAGVDEVHEAGAAVELGEEDSGVGLGLGAFDPLKARPNAAVLATPLAEYSTSITTHPHFFLLSSEQHWHLKRDEREQGFMGFCLLV